MKRQIWCPGNGTRYDLYYSETEDNPTKLFISWMRYGGSGGYSFAFRPDTHVHYTYIMEKMGLGEGDAAGILSFISKQLGINITMPPGFNEDGCFVGSATMTSWIHE